VEQYGAVKEKIESERKQVLAFVLKSQVKNSNESVDIDEEKRVGSDE